MRILKRTFAFICILYISSDIVESFLAFSNGGLFKLVIGWAIPVDVPMAVIYVQNVQFQYNTVDNASKYAVVFQEERQLKNPITRNHLMHVLDPYLNRECFLYLICESSALPLVNSGLIGELLQIIFTPSPYSDNVLIDAWKKGKNRRIDGINTCAEEFKQCLFIQELIEPFLKYTVS
ncbi:uncharacterized protein LOC142318297 [Lycorma delicatula]|uniref:uncharacterized protein LOC142318297 n=1 Tax=Lycorma delicatula TaxID=130591 RepID=UPI003F51A353